MSDHDMTRWRSSVGPFRAQDIRDGDPYELSNGHLIHCKNPDDRSSQARRSGGGVLSSDPGVTGVGADAGIAFNDDKNLRAPDLVVNVDLSELGWVRHVPPLVLEYVSTDRDMDELSRKISEFLELGTKFIWVVHLVGPLRVDVHEPGLPVRTMFGDGVLTAPGVLKNPVPVRALVDPEASHEATLHNLLTRKGYASIDAIREEGREAGLEGALTTARERLYAQLHARGWSLAPFLKDRITACTDLSVLLGWLMATVTAESAEAALR